MSRTGFLARFASKLWFWYLAVFVLILIAHIIIFRDVVAAIPAIWSGDTAIVREELVPFFDFSTQFWGENTSSLTSSDEVRTGYSFWTAWVRYAPVLPVALVLLNTVSAFLLFYAFHYVGRYFSKDRPYFGIVAALLATAVIHGILLYAKLAHFYVLIIGFSLFALAVSLVIDQIFFKKDLKRSNMAALSLVVLINPAVHYHVIFYLIFAMILLVHTIFVWIVNRSYFGFYLKKHIIYFLVVLVVSFVPYVLLLVATVSSANLSAVSTDIPVNYWLIYYSSLALPFIFSFDTAGHLDLMRYGNYLAPLPRIGSVVITILVGSLFLFKQWAVLGLLRKVLLATLFVIMLIAMWMSIGYGASSIFSFHTLLSNIAMFLADQANVVAEAVGRGLAIFINILRFPHRFQFIYFYVGGLLLMIVLVWLQGTLHKRLGKRLLSAVIVVLIALFPLYASGDYRTALASGNFASFAAPYHVPEDLAKVKQILSSQTGDKLFILPTMESGREILQDGQRYSFLDKFFIYYLNQPALYYGVGASTQNKIISYLVYRSIAFKEQWWEDVLANNLGITHILVPKHMQARQSGITYLPGIEERVDEALAKSTKYSSVYDGKDFALYSLNQPSNQSDASMVDLQWGTFVEFMQGGGVASQNFNFPLQVNSFLNQNGGNLISDNPERSFYTLYAATQAAQVYYPNSTLLAFDKDLVASSNFTNNSLSLSTLYTVDDEYNYLHEVIPSLASLRVPQFTGLTKGAGRLSVPFSVPADGTYRLVLHGGSRASEIAAHLGGQQVKLQKVNGDLEGAKDYIDFTYFYVDLPLVAGKHVLEVQNASENAVLTESVMIIPQKDVPSDFANAKAAGFSLLPTEEPSTYKVTLPKGANE